MLWRRLLLVAMFPGLGAIVSGRAGDAEARTWTDTSGSHAIEAELVDYNGGIVRLKKSDGRMISVPISRLSTTDRDFVRDHLDTNTVPHTTSAGPPTFVRTEAMIELLSGAKTRGRITARDDRYVTVEVTIGSRSFSRKYPTDRIRAIVAGGRREVLNERTAAGPGTSSPTVSGTGNVPSAGSRRTGAAIDALVDKMGRTPPDWWDSVPLEYPSTLDLSWPQPPPKGWNSQRNVGQYVWDIINRNPSKWRSGVRFMHHMLQRHQNNPVLQRRVMNELGSMYFALLQDYPRAVFWWRKANVDRGDRYIGSGLRMAECYWKLGNKQMALELLNKIPLQFGSIKLLGDMGETRRALQIADSNSRGSAADLAFLYAGEVCRVAGDYQGALGYYQKLLAMRAVGQPAKRIQRNQQLARASVEAIRLFELLDVGRVPDGTYRGSSLGYEAQVQVEVVVKDGRIESVRVTEHHEKQFYSCLTDTPQKIVQMQGVKGVDAFTGATITSKAIMNATAKALAGAMK